MDWAQVGQNEACGEPCGSTLEACAHGTRTLEPCGSTLARTLCFRRNQLIYEGSARLHASEVTFRRQRKVFRQKGGPLGFELAALVALAVNVAGKMNVTGFDAVLVEQLRQRVLRQPGLLLAPCRPRRL